MRQPCLGACLYCYSLPMKTALFDFDGTITRHDTFISFGRFSAGYPAFNCAVLKSIPYIVAWKLRLASNSYAKQRLFSFLDRGMEYEKFRELGEISRLVIDDDTWAYGDSSCPCQILKRSVAPKRRGRPRWTKALPIERK